MKQDTDLSFVGYLEAQLAARKCRKGQRTRERLRIATAKVLSERSFNEMRALDITEMAALAEGSFYLYFKNKTEVTVSVIEEFCTEFLGLQGLSQPSMSRFEEIRVANRRWLQVAAANPGLMRCFLQASHEVPELSAVVNQLNRRWHQRIVESVARRSSEGSSVSILAVYLMGGLIDEITRRMIIYPDSEMLAALGAAGVDLDSAADAASVVWHRILYPSLDLEPDMMPSAGWLSKLTKHCARSC
jgi:AcrR family transcriptional regulator